MTRRGQRRKKSLPANEYKQPGTTKESPPQVRGIVSQSGHIVQRPAQLSPEIVEKFQREDIQALVQSFAESVKYQNQTDRQTREMHYKTEKQINEIHYSRLNRKDTKNSVVSIIVFISTMIYFYVTKSSVSNTLLLALLTGLFLLSFGTFGKIFSFFENLFHKKTTKKETI